MIWQILPPGGCYCEVHRHKTVDLSDPDAALPQGRKLTRAQRRSKLRRRL
jgi:hypothetical protein